MTIRKRIEIDIAHYEDPKFQNLLQRAFDRGIWPVVNLVAQQPANISNIAVLVVTSVLATKLNSAVYLIVILSLLPSFFLELKYGAQKWDIWAENSPRQKKYAHLRGHAHSRTSVIQLKLLQAKDKVLEIVRGILESFRNEQLRVDNSRLFALGFSNLVVALGFGYSFFLIVQDVNLGLIAVGELVFLVGILGQFIGATNSFLSGIALQYEGSLFVSDIFEVFDIKPKVQKPKNPIFLNLNSAPMIEFRDVWFQYEGQENWVLSGLNFKIDSGEKIALVGENGAGKTTLIKLLARVYDPTKGQILINGINLKEIDLEEWPSYLAILLQDYDSYDFPIWESIAMGRTNRKASRERAIIASKLASADDFITAWPRGFDQQIGRDFEGGIDPSKGQNQKIAIARTIYRDGLIVILDEPTASVDAKSEEKIFDQMEETARDKTLILISHRFNTVSGADRILVFSGGKIVESGTHKELLAKDAHYASMWRSQAKAYQENKEEEVA